MHLDSFSLNDSFEVFANWWLPESPQNKVPGTLESSPAGGAILTLQGAFDHPGLTDLRSLFSGTGFEAERIYGEQPDGQLITLCQVFAIKVSDTCSFRCQFVLAGVHEAQGVPVDPVYALFSFENLEEWSCVPFLQPERSSLLDRTTYSFPNSPLEHFRLANNETHHELSFTTSTAGKLTRVDALFESKAHFRASFQGSAIEPMLSFVNDVGQFVTILIGEPAILCNLRYASGANAVDVFFERARQASSKKRASPEMPFSLRDIGGRAILLFSSWLASVPLMRPVYSTFFSTLFNDLSYIDTKFQSLVQAVEGFHRRSFSGTYLNEEGYSTAYSCLVKAIPADLEPSLKDRLKNAIKYGNEFSLRRRLKDLVDGLEAKTREILQIEGAFQSEVVDARNYYAHLHEATKPACIGNGRALYFLNQKLSALFLILVLKSLGMPEADARDGVIKRRRFS